MSIKVLLFKVEMREDKEGSISAVLKLLNAEDVDKRLKEMYGCLNCDYVECVQVNIDGEQYDLWCDEEFLLKGKKFPTLYINEELIIYGNFLFARSNEDGEMISLKSEDFGKIISFYHRQLLKLVEWINKERKERGINEELELGICQLSR